MSATQETNNQNRVSTPDNLSVDTNVQAYARDPNYYYEDGNIVFLVGDMLFKVRDDLIHSLWTSLVY